MLVAGLVLAASVMQAGAQDDATFWCTHALQNVFKDVAAPVGDTGSLVLSGARGQTVGAQIVIRGGSTPSRVSNVRCSGLRTDDARNVIGASAFHSAFVEYYPVAKNSTHTPATELVRQAPADFPDAFSEASEVIVPARTNQPIWVQFRIPAGARPGTYLGMVDADVDGDPLQVPVTLTVYDFALPSDTRLFVTVWTNTASLAKHQNVKEGTDQWWALIERVAALMRAHHQNVILTPWTLIKARRNVEGKLELDFADFDRWVRIFRANGFRRIEVSHVGGREHGQWEDKTFVSYDMPCAVAKDGQADKAAIEEWLPLLQAHLQERGWLEQTMIHVADEPIEVNLESWKALSERVKKAAPRLRRIDAVHVPDLRGSLEVWVPQLNYLEQWMQRFVEAQKAGVELWYYTAWVPQGRYPNRLMDYPLIKTRMLHWLNYTSGTTGYLHWGWNFWDVPFDQFAPGDNFIVYPGKQTPRSSLRYEAMREGIEDYEYLCLLEEAVASAARRIRASGFDARTFVRKYAETLAPTFQDYSRDPRRLYAVRDAVARSIEALSGAVPMAALAVQTGADAEVIGFAPPGCTVSVGEVSSAPGPDGRFSLVATGAKGDVEITVRLGERTVKVKTPLIPEP
jgi:hypothetical protein